MRTVQLEHTYEGHFEIVGTTKEGAPMFESVQSLDTDALPEGFQPELEVNAIKWSVDAKGKLTGTAKFISLATHDIVTASLAGTSPEPPEGQDYREAFVNVTFTGGTRTCCNATGQGKVEARLYNDGLSRGTIKGSVELPDS